MPDLATPAPPPLRWDIFCRVIDNHGDLGVCWRLAADLAERGHQVRLWLDDARALAWVAPVRPAGVEVVAWSDPAPDHAPGDVVIEAFGCNPHDSFLARMAAAAKAPVWVNLEYLSAEDYVAHSHRLASPQWHGPAQGLTKWFFFPGFTPDTGGLLREPDLLQRLAEVDADSFLARLDITPQPGERLVSVFCYANAALAELPACLADAPTLILATPGTATEQLAALPMPRKVRVQALPWLSQPDYDHLLRACALNFVRGEDSFVRAQWAAKPFVWQIYPQHDGVHAGKLDAFLQRHLAGADPALSQQVQAWMLAWNGLAARGQPALPMCLAGLDSWQDHALVWRDHLHSQRDLTSQLLDFVSEKR
ncbi:MAG: elongation factor P maturation arginine rhamnosyltransferase EarP [Vitreoscilla sp.]|nr:elongation factor P maturation arginine rhamnosyltransferase EarP [Burkholderiales bacterium]MBP6336221.1 elongation factor P maturation arginine rhamnosyltransferase EarP [Vitreoscilla sp.]MBP6673971.1 elongation factor P maturation arginine rhamnosyltransferase EarP [Vitreoscilla sp.]